MSSPPYVVVLAGGEGTRLASLTRALNGNDLPEQFAVATPSHDRLVARIRGTAAFAS